jgi:nucleotide-binding universal stress UspA family protein
MRINIVGSLGPIFNICSNDFMAMTVKLAYKSILVHVDVERGSSARIKLATALAARSHALLIGVAMITPTESEIIHDVTLDNYNANLNPDTSSRLINLAHAKERFFEAAAPYRQVEWRDGADFPTAGILHEARAADVIVVEHPSSKPRLTLSVNVPRLILQAGRPVLLVPRRLDRIDLTNVVIGWKDTREARRAVCDALPLLQYASKIILFEACEPGVEPHAMQRLSDVELYLMRHGLPKCVKLCNNETHNPGRAMARIANEEGRAPIVAGAYGHSRLGEWVFGGATAELLESCPVPCVLSH